LTNYSGAPHSAPSADGRPRAARQPGAARRVKLWLTFACCAVFAAAAVHNLIAGALGDERGEYDRVTVERAARLFPRAARVQARLADAELSDAARDEESLARAEAAALSAARLAPRDYKTWALLARVRRARGDLTGEEEALRRALALAPHYTELRWLLANLLVRAGQTAHAVGEFAAVAQARPELLPASLELTWRITGGDLKAAGEVVGPQPEARLTLADFLLGQSRETEAVAVFTQVDRQARLTSARGAQFINSLVEEGRLEPARRLWFDTVGEPPQPLRDGGFEAEAVKGFGHFGWLIGQSNYAAISVSPAQARSGSRSLKITFAGRHTTRLDGEVRQLIAVTPGARYRLECYARAEKLVTSEGVVIAVTGVKPGAWAATSNPVAPGVAGWQPLTIDFVAPPDASFLNLTVRRTPRFSYDEPTTGTIWLDDFALTER
jgi:tetratricopeptide (TPR) repeat protein